MAFFAALRELLLKLDSFVNMLVTQGLLVNNELEDASFSTTKGTKRSFYPFVFFVPFVVNSLSLPVSIFMKSR